MTEPASSPGLGGLDAETVDRLNATLENLNSSLSSKAVQPPSGTTPDLDSDLAQLDPEMAQIVTKIVDAKIGKLRGEYLTEQKNKAIQRYNEKIAVEFPELSNKLSPLSKATVKEIQRRLEENPRYVEDTPSAVYDAACAAALAVGQGTRPTPPKAPSSDTTSGDGRRLSTLTGGYMPHGTPPPANAPASDTLTAEQEHFAAKMGVPKEAYTGFVGVDEGNGSITLLPPKTK